MRRYFMDITRTLRNTLNITPDERENRSTDSPPPFDIMQRHIPRFGAASPVLGKRDREDPVEDECPPLKRAHPHQRDDDVDEICVPEGLATDADCAIVFLENHLGYLLARANKISRARARALLDKAVAGSDRYQALRDFRYEMRDMLSRGAPEDGDVPFVSELVCHIVSSHARALARTHAKLLAKAPGVFTATFTECPPALGQLSKFLTSVDFRVRRRCGRPDDIEHEFFYDMFCECWSARGYGPDQGVAKNMYTDESVLQRALCVIFSPSPARAPDGPLVLEMYQ